MGGPQRWWSGRGEEAVAARVSQKVAVGVVFVAAMFMSIMDVTIVNVALPTIGRDFGGEPDGGRQHLDRLPGQPGRVHPGVRLAR